MGRVLVQQWASADGMVAGPGGEDDVFAAVADFSPSDRHDAALLESVDEVLVGRRTYEVFAGLGAAPWGAHAPARVVPDASAHVRARRGDPGAGTTIVWGRISVARALLEAGLVDDVELFVAPLLLGTGRPLLDGTGPAVRPALQDSETWPGGTLRARYAVG